MHKDRHKLKSKCRKIRWVATPLLETAWASRAAPRDVELTQPHEHRAILQQLGSVRLAVEGWLGVAAEQTAATAPAQLAEIEL